MWEQKYADFSLAQFVRNIIISPSETEVTCNNCNKRLLTKKLSAGFASTITVKIANDKVTLTLLPDVLNEYFNKKDIVKEFFENPEKLRNTLMAL